MINKSGTPGLYAQPGSLTGLKGLPHSLKAPYNRGWKPAGLSLMVKFPAGEPIRR